MKRRNFIQSSVVLASASVAGTANAMATSSPAAAEPEIYELRRYHFTGGGGKTALDNFYKESLIPIMNKNGVKVGAFGEYGMSEPPVVYYILAYPSMAEYLRIKKEIWNDESFTKSAQTYFDNNLDKGAYTRFETYLLRAFDGIPKFRQPDKVRGLIELRIYESSNEEAGQRKVKMFNNEEIALFDKVGLNCLLFGEVLAGPQMPSLAYMLWFTDMEQRAANWKKFSGSDEWKVLSNKPEYAKTVSQVNKTFLVPLDYSQI